MNTKIGIKFSLLIMLLFLVPFSFGQQPEKTLLNDIEIMETVLDKIISPKMSNINFLGSNSKGFYLKDYGVIFNVSYSPQEQRIISFTRDGNLETHGNEVIVVGENNEAKKENYRDEVNKIKESLFRFYSDWAPALTSLSKNERVTVIVDFNRFFPRWYRSPMDETDAPFKQLITSVTMKDITEHKREKINANQLRNIIQYDEIKSVDEDISILSNVIQTSLDRRNENINLSTSGDVRGIYFKGYGAVFITNLTPAAQSVQMYLRSLYKDGARSVTMKNNFNNGDLNEDHLKKVEEKMIKILSSYGHTLKNLQEDEWLEIALNLQGTFFNEDYSKSILKIQKKKLDQFNKDKITYDQLKKEFKIIRY